jgi:ankyrin repeat protein
MLRIGHNSRSRIFDLPTEEDPLNRFCDEYKNLEQNKKIPFVINKLVTNFNSSNFEFCEKLSECILTLEENPLIRPRLYNGTPSYISYAIEHGNLKAVQLLLKYKLNDIEHRNASGHTPLHEAVNLKNEEIASFLISYGANVNSMSVSDGSTWLNDFGLHIGKSILHDSLLLSLKNVTNLLIKHGANPFQEGSVNDGVETTIMTPVKLAVSLKLEMSEISFLLEHMNEKQFIPFMLDCLSNNKIDILNLHLDYISAKNIYKIINYINNNPPTIVDLVSFAEFEILNLSSEIAEEYLNNLINNIIHELNKRLKEIHEVRKELLNSKLAQSLYKLIPNLIKIDEDKYKEIKIKCDEFNIPDDILAMVLEYIIPYQSKMSIMGIKKALN